MPDTAKNRSSAALGPQPTWTAVLKAYLVDYIVLVTLALVTLWCETAAPFTKVNYWQGFHDNLSHRHRSALSANSQLRCCPEQMMFGLSNVDDHHLIHL